MSDRLNAEERGTLMEQLLYEVKRVVVGQDRFLERVLVAMLAQGHLLVEGVPGLAKTLTVKTLARSFSGTFKRIQFTPDLVPADLVGTRVYNDGGVAQLVIDGSCVVVVPRQVDVVGDSPLVADGVRAR